VTEKEQK